MLKFGDEHRKSYRARHGDRGGLCHFLPPRKRFRIRRIVSLLRCAENLGKVHI